ncbi:MAG: sigma-70 family RNA polymerase sigma factor [Pseudomonadota bacterium]
MASANDAFTDGLVGLLPRLRRFALVLSQSEPVADDLVQAAVERALNRRHQWQEGSKLDAWVFTILHSIWRNEKRASAIRDGKGFFDPDQIASPHGDNERTILLAQVFEQVNSLPEAQREAMVLVYVEGYAYEEAASVLGIPSGTLMSRLARARSALARSVSERDDPKAQRVNQRR